MNSGAVQPSPPQPHQRAQLNTHPSGRFCLYWCLGLSDETPLPPLHAMQALYASHLARDEGGHIAAFLDDAAVRVLQASVARMAGGQLAVRLANAAEFPAGCEYQVRLVVRLAVRLALRLAVRLAAGHRGVGVTGGGRLCSDARAGLGPSGPPLDPQDGEVGRPPHMCHGRAHKRHRAQQHRWPAGCLHGLVAAWAGWPLELAHDAGAGVHPTHQPA
jgi:hypothetical protein